MKPIYNPNKATAYDPNKKPKKRNSPKYDPKQASVYEEGEEAYEEGGFIDTAIDTMDVPGSILRAGIGGGLDADKSALGEAGRQAGAILTKGPSESVNAPTGSELLEKAGLFEETDDSWNKTLLGIGAEAALDPLNVVNPAKGLAKLASKGLRKGLKKKLTKSTARALSHIENISKANVSKGFDPEVVSRRLVEEDLVKHISNPTKLLEKLSGARGINTRHAKSGVIIKRGERKGGLISDASKSMKELIDEASKMMPEVKNSRISLPVEDFYDDLIEDATKASGLVDADKAKISEIVGKYVKGDSYTVNELFALKKDLSKNLSSQLYFQPADKAMALEKELMMKIERNIDTQLQDMLGNVEIQGQNAGDLYSLQNNRMHQFITTKNFLEMTPIKELKNANIPTLMASATAKGAGWAIPSFLLENVSGMGGLGMGGMAAGMGVDLGATGSRAIRENMPAIEAQMLDKASHAPETLLKVAPEAGRMYRDEDEKREESSANPMSPQARLDINLPKMLNKMKLPRNSQEIIDNPDLQKLLKLKVAQGSEGTIRDMYSKAGQNPNDVHPEDIARGAQEYYKNIEMLVDENMDDFSAAMPMLTTTHPELFKKDSKGLNRIDNTVPASRRQDASEMIRKSGRYGTKKSTHEMIAELDELNSTGKYYDKPEGVA